MMGNLVEATTMIDETVEKINKCLDKISSEISLSIKERGRISSQELDNLIKALPLEYQIVVLKSVIIKLNGNESTSKQKMKTSRADYFGSRGF